MNGDVANERQCAATVVNGSIANDKVKFNRGLLPAGQHEHQQDGEKQDVAHRMNTPHYRSLG
jgi:hypothetical protein